MFLSPPWVGGCIRPTVSLRRLAGVHIVSPFRPVQKPTLESRLRFAAFVVLFASVSSALRAADAPFEPELVGFELTIEPTRRQIATMPRAPVVWRIAPALAARFDNVIAAGGFDESLATALRERFRISAENAEGIIVPDVALLDMFRPTERLRWWAVLAGHSANRSYRWPVAIRSTTLDELSAEPEYAAAVQRVRSWGVAIGERVLFGDLFAVESELRSEEIRERFLQKLIGARTLFAKVATDGSGRTADSAFAYWESLGRSRSVESFLRATRRIEEHDRLDLAHLLPRLARSLLYTFPPDFGVVEEPSVENAALAVSFFAPEVEPRSVLASGFSAWLAANCERVDGARGFGDIVVFEDPATRRWPFAMVHVADGVLFGRRPTIHGPWELLREQDVPQMNPRLRGNATTAYRMRRESPPPPRAVIDQAPVSGSLRAAAPELRDLPIGAWGRLKCYDVLLAPSTELLERLPVPERRPKWVFAGVSPEEIRATIDGIEMPAPVRRELHLLFGGLPGNWRGPITVHPSVELVRATPAAFRERLFPYLVHGIEATDYLQDISIATRATPSEWFAASTLPGPMRQLVLDLAYRRGGGLALSDFGTLYHGADDPVERNELLRAVYQTPVLIVLMERPRSGEIASLVEYWRLDQQKSIGRLLESFATTPDMRHLDIVHLLPPLAREMLNVFMHAPSNAPTPSCYWTALNFAAERPDSRLLITARAPGREDAIAWRKLQEEYVLVEAPSQLGDVIAYRRRADGDLRHLCTFVAADIVYTKNGFGSSSPWCLMHLDDVDALYLERGQVDRLVFRATEAPSRGMARP